MSTARVLALLELLQSRRRITGPEIAAALQVHPRTVRRDVAALVALGIPVAAERGRDGAYLLTAGYKLPPLMFSDDEALALSLGLVAARALGLASIAPAVASALAKLERVMPAALQQRVRAVDTGVRLDLRPRERAEGQDADSHALATLTAAAQRQQRVQLVYRTPQGAESTREFDPFGLAYYLGRWYAVGHCHLRRGMRSFRLDRVQAVQPRPASFGRPPDFDALDYVREAVTTLPRAHQVRLRLHTDLATARERLFTEIGTLQLEREGHAPSVLLRSEVDDLDWVARELSRWPFAVDVLEPVALVEVLALHAKRLAADARRSRRLGAAPTLSAVPSAPAPGASPARPGASGAAPSRSPAGALPSGRRSRRAGRRPSSSSRRPRTSRGPAPQ